jgi:hypothetical protein
MEEGAGVPVVEEGAWARAMEEGCTEEVSVRMMRWCGGTTGGGAEEVETRSLASSSGRKRDEKYEEEG